MAGQHKVHRKEVPYVEVPFPGLGAVILQLWGALRSHCSGMGSVHQVREWQVPRKLVSDHCDGWARESETSTHNLQAHKTPVNYGLHLLSSYFSIATLSFSDKIVYSSIISIKIHLRDFLKLYFCKNDFVRDFANHYTHLFCIVRHPIGEKVKNKDVLWLNCFCIYNLKHSFALD